MRLAFTAVELLIAVALSALLLTFAFMGFRSASQGMIASNRQSVQNALLRAGFDKALDELDYWSAYDLPEDSSGLADAYLASNRFMNLRALRILAPESGSVYGLPFSAVRHWGGVLLDGNQPFAPGSPVWEAFSHPWRATDERTWIRGNYFHSHKDGSGNTWPHGVGGRYEIVSSRTAGAVAHPGGQPDFGRWLADVAWGMRQGFGTYAFTDYLPANAPAAFHEPTGNTIRYLGPGHGTHTFPHVQGLRRAYQRTAIGIWPYHPWSEERSQGAQAIHTRNWSSVIWSFRTTGLNLTLSTTSSDVGYQLRGLSVLEPIQPISPPGWPIGESGIARYHAGGRFINLVRLRWSETASSDQVEITFGCLGTTLRGARQQRRAPAHGTPVPLSSLADVADALPPDGWIIWNGNDWGPGPAPIIEPTLDTP